MKEVFVLLEHFKSEIERLEIRINKLESIEWYRTYKEEQNEWREE